MAGVYCLRHPERTVLYRVLFHHFDRFVAEYEDLVVAKWANYSNRGKGDIGGVARRKPQYLIPGIPVSNMS
jgi:hypothetical protein